MDPGIQKYFAFVQTVESGSFTKAAEALHYSQSGISRMISALEDEWKVTLLERGRSGVSLTSDGIRLLPYASGICNEYRKLQMEVDELNGLQAGLIRIGTLSSVAAHWLPNILRAFTKDHPNIDYELLLGDYVDIEQWIMEGRVDCGITRLPCTNAMDAALLEEEEMMVILPKNHPLAERDAFPVEALCDSPFMLLERGAKAEVSAIFDRYHLKPNIKLVTWDDYAVMSMVESGLGISIVPKMMQERLQYDILFKSLEEPVYRQIGFVVRSQASASVAVRRFVRYLEYRKPAPDGG